MNKNPDLIDATFFYCLCNLMADFAYDEWKHNKLNIRKVKYLSNQLCDELERSIDVLFDKSIDGDFNKISEQFINATEMMENFFKIGLKMEDLPDHKKTEMNDKLNEIINQYLPNYENN